MNIERAADARGVAIREHVDEVVAQFKAAFEKLGVTYDRWIRTTDPHHEAAVQALWRVLEDRGHIYKGNRVDVCSYCNEFKDVDAKEARSAVSRSRAASDRIAEERRVTSSSYRSFRSRCSNTTRSIRVWQPDVRRNEVVSL